MSLRFYKKSKVVTEFIHLCNTDEQFNNALQSTTKSISATFYRLQTWGEALNSLLGCSVNIPEVSAEIR